VGEPEAGMTGLVIGDDSIIYVISCDGTSSHPGENTLIALRPNSLPVADAGADQVLEATSPSGALVSLDGSDSTDADSTPGTNDDIVLFEWILEGDVIATGETTSETLPLGVNVVTLRVTDSRGASDEDEVQITVEDTTPPEITLSVTPEMLWPPNHKMVEIVPTITVTDLCDPAPSVALKSISMDEGDETNTYDPAFDNTVGDGNTTDDIQVDADGRIFLRAERSGLGDGRVYTIIYEVTDASGNSSEASATVVVPHNL